MAEIQVQLTQIIHRPTALVRQHFLDIAHHERHPVHAGVRFQVLEQSPNHCLYLQKTAMGPFTLQERSQLELVDGKLVNRCLEGASQGMVATFSFREHGPGETEVAVDIRVPKTGLRWLLGALFRSLVQRGFTRALEEDRIDLEVNGYPRQ